LSALAKTGVPVSFIRGNRDFLLRDGYARRAGMAILPDPAVVMLHGKPTLLMHGDLLCTGDVAYQQFRAQTRQPEWQRQFLSQPLPARVAFAQQAREASKAHQSGLQQAGQMETITDVAPDTVATTFARYGIDTIIHGHTHRPAVHTHEGGTRIVLGDWYHQGSVLRVDANGARLSSL
jgi:UDP-2,3-diacylglucosamine hydrolase